MVKYSRKIKKMSRKNSKRTKGGTRSLNNSDINNLDISEIYETDDSDIHDISEYDNDLNFEDGIENSLNTTRDSISSPEVNEYNESDLGDMDSLHLSDLNDSGISSTNTTIESFSQPNIDDDISSLHLSDLNSSNVSSRNTSREYSTGGKTKRKHGRKTKKTKKTTKKMNKTKRKMRRIKIGGNVDKLGDSDFNPNLTYDSKQVGGRCYGTGVGANNYDPNFSIYNTKLLQLSPYNPTN